MFICPDTTSAVQPLTLMLEPVMEPVDFDVTLPLTVQLVILRFLALTLLWAVMPLNVKDSEFDPVIEPVTIPEFRVTPPLILAKFRLPPSVFPPRLSVKL